MPAWHQAQPGENPMEMISKYSGQKAGVIKIVLAVMALCLLCGIPMVLISRSAASKNAATPTAAATVTATATETPTGTTTPRLGFLQASPTPAATQTPWIVITRLPGNTNTIEKHFVSTVLVPVLQTVIVTSTPVPTQTPWLVYATVIVEVTVEVTPTETPSPTPTPTETATPEITLEVAP